MRWSGEELRKTLRIFLGTLRYKNTDIDTPLTKVLFLQGTFKIVTDPRTLKVNSECLQFSFRDLQYSVFRIS